MQFLSVNGYSIKPGKSRAYQAWSEANRDRIQKAAPEGFEFIGTFAVVQSSEKSAGNWMDVWKFDSYAAMDDFAASMRSGDLAPILEEAAQFWDASFDAPWSQMVLKDIIDASVIDVGD